MTKSEGADLASGVLAGDRRAAARLITLIDNEQPEAVGALKRLFPHTGGAHVIGVTGPPGAGKSSLVNEIAREYRRGGQTVGIIAVDPSSPFTGGALLGDRVRMPELAADEGIFIRSMASRGVLGGISAATHETLAVLDTLGYQRLIVETVGVGQAEVDIARTADTVVVVETPGLGDEVQAIKAGILEIADLFVINKADQPGAEAMAGHLHFALEDRPDGWETPILRTIATEPAGVAELVESIERHRAYLQSSNEHQVRRRTRTASLISGLVQRAMLREVASNDENGPLGALLDEVLERRLDPYEAVESLLTQRRSR